MDTSINIEKQVKPHFYVMQSFAKLLAHEAGKLLHANERVYFDGEIILSTAIIHRFIWSKIFPHPYTVIETNYFKKSIKKITDTEIIKKLYEFQRLLTAGDQRLNDNSLNKRERFVSSNSTGYFDKNGRFVIDFLADLCGIQHFHIGYDKKTHDNLLFVRFEGDTAFLLTVGSHKDIHVDSGISTVFSAIEAEFPSELDRLFPPLTGICPGDSPHDEQEAITRAKVLKSAGIVSSFSDASGCPRMLGLGFTTARTPLATTIFIDRVTEELRYIFFKKDGYEYYDTPISIVSLERIDSIPYVISCQRAPNLKLRYTFTQINNTYNTSKLIDMIDIIYFIKGLKRKSIGKILKQKCPSINLVRI